MEPLEFFSLFLFDSASNSRNRFWSPPKRTRQTWTSSFHGSSEHLVSFSPWENCWFPRFQYSVSSDQSWSASLNLGLFGLRKLESAVYPCSLCSQRPISSEIPCLLLAQFFAISIFNPMAFGYLLPSSYSNLLSINPQNTNIFFHSPHWHKECY